MKTFILAVAFVGIMSAQSFTAEPPRVGQMYWWDSDTLLGYGGVPKTQLTVIEVYGSGVKLKMRAATNTHSATPCFSSTLAVCTCWCLMMPRKSAAND